MIDLPSWIDPECWEGFVEMRAAKGKRVPFTPRAAKMILKTLLELKEAGHDPNASLDQSAKLGYSDVYEPRDRVIRRKVGAPSRAWFNEQDKRDAENSARTPEQKEATRLRLLKAKQTIRRVA